MALAPIIKLGTTQAASRPKALYVGGVDVTLQSTYATPIESIVVDEAGPDSVSSMSFTIECTTAQPVVVAEGMEVRFDNNTSGYRYFQGWVDHVDIENMDGNIGTRYQVQATGVESILDGCILPNDVTIPAGTAAETAVLALTGQAVGPGMAYLRAFASSTGSSNAAGPIANGMGTLSNAITVTAGTTLREGIRQVTGQIPITGSYPGTGAVTPLDIIYATVDFYFGLRYYHFGVVDGGGNITIDDNPPLTALQAGDLQYGIDAASVRGVVVKGTGVTVTVGDGTGKPGSMAVLTDSTITTVAAATAVGTAYLGQYASKARGRYTLEDYAPGVAIPVYSTETLITDARVGLIGSAVAGEYVITDIVKTFNPSQRENWTVSFGGAPPSMADLTRQLTRGTLS